MTLLSLLIAAGGTIGFPLALLVMERRDGRLRRAI
jgi:hypothetical protein